MIYIGIDPGKKGALAIIDSKEVITVPFSKKSYNETIEKYANKDCLCIVENVHAMPNQGVKSTFNFGKNFGFIIGLLEAFNINYILVSPQKWKAKIGVTKDKESSIKLVHKLYPSANLKRTNRSIKDDDNIAESILLARYGKVKGDTND